MDLVQRQGKYKLIEEYRERPLIVYATSTRPNLNAMMASDAIREFIDQINSIGGGDQVDVLINSTAGDLNAGLLRVRRCAWRSSINEGGKGKNSTREVTLGPAVIGIMKEHMDTERSQRGFLLENSLGMPVDLDALAKDVIRPTFAAAGLEWKGYYGGRRGAETEMNRYTNGNSQITSHHFGHTKAVADAHYIKPLPEETRIAALALDSTLRETIGRLEHRVGSSVN